MFDEDLNVADHSIIRSLIFEIFNSVGVEYDSTAFNWSDLEAYAYDSAKAMTHEDFIAEMARSMPTIEVIGKYVNANRRIKVKCKECGFVWDAAPANLKRGDGCRKCGAKLRGVKERRRQADFEKELREINPFVQIVGVYTGRHNTIKVRCLKCDNIWEATAGSLLRKDQILITMVALNVQKEKWEPRGKKFLMLKLEKYLIRLAMLEKSITQYLQRSANVAVELVQHQKDFIGNI